MKATITTRHERPAIVADATAPDHTRSMSSRVTDGELRTTIEREGTGSLHATVDDYLVGLIVADECANRHTTETMTSTEPTDTNQ